MAWTTPTWIDFRGTAGFVTDPSGAGPLLGASTSPTNLPAYNPASTGSNSPITINGNTFNCGWSVVGDANNGAANISSSVTDKRLAGGHFGDNDVGGPYTLSVQAGTAAGIYNIWLGITQQGGYGFPAGTITIADANGTLATVTLPSGHATGNNVCDATGTAYTTAALWAAANPVAGGGSFITVTSTDTSNGNGGPLLKFTPSGNLPFATLGIQFAGGGGGSNPPPQPSPFAIGAGLILAPLGWVIRRRNRLMRIGASLLPRGVNPASFAHN